MRNHFGNGQVQPKHQNLDESIGSNKPSDEDDDVPYILPSNFGNGPNFDRSGSGGIRDEDEMGMGMNTPPNRTPSKEYQQNILEFGGNSTTAKKDPKSRFTNMFSNSTDGLNEEVGSSDMDSRMERMDANGHGVTSSRFNIDYNILEVRREMGGEGRE